MSEGSSSNQERNQAIRDVVKGASVVYAGLLAEVVIAFIAQVIAARYLTTGGFGGLTVGTSMVNICGLVASLGMASGLTRYLPRTDPPAKRALVRTAFVSSLPVAVVMGVGIALNAEFIASGIFGDPEVTPSIFVFGLTIPFATALNVAIGGIRGQKVSKYRVYVENFIRPIVRLSLVFAVVTVGLGQLGFATAYAVPYAVGALVAVFYLFRVLPGILEESTLQSGSTREMTRYSLPFIVSGAAGFMYRSIDVFIVLYFLDSQAVGTYGVAYAAARLIVMFSTAFNFLGAPVASELEAGENVRDMLSVHRSVLRLLVIATIPTLIPFVLFPEAFISAVYGSKYASGSLTLAVLALGFAVHNVLDAHTSLLQGLGRSREIAFNNILAASLNVGLNVWLIPEIGILGAALATIASYFLVDLLMVVEVRYYVGVFPFGLTVAKPGIIAVPLLVSAFLLRDFVPGRILWIVGFTAVFGLVYIVTVLVVLGIRPEEVMLIRSLEERYGIPLGPLDAVVRRFS
ncbi:flippase [Halomarina salina]|uniref:Flippase n=1 Tax=Halomarina salina TaxID=1872699 RepID=A0ABD5RLG3_9EURY|nr:flippase [Halomarina salina]